MREMRVMAVGLESGALRPVLVLQEASGDHRLLPVWIGAYRFQSRVFQVTVNARTGEVQGERPYSAVKIALAVIVALIVILILVWVASQQS